MIINLRKKYSVSPEWFEEQCEKDGWVEWLWQLFSIYGIKDQADTKLTTEKMKVAGIDKELVSAVME